MKYRIKHVTTYQYADQVTLCQNHARLTPISSQNQTCLSSEITILPKPDYIRHFTDYFGNQVTVFDVPTQHDTLTVTAVSEVDVFSHAQQGFFEQEMTWEQARDTLKFPTNAQLLNAAEFCIPSVFTPISEDIKAYAQASFLPNRSIIKACECLMARIFNDFEYNPNFTTISTPLSEVFAHKKGVCQDFAHFALACIRSLGLAAKYVSGYIETIPPEGVEKLEGADATHAWFAIYVPFFGWLDFDPTNNVLPTDQHITLALGRDFADITPLKGVVFGGGSHNLNVAVDMRRLPQTQQSPQLQQTQTQQ